MIQIHLGMVPATIITHMCARNDHSESLLVAYCIHESTKILQTSSFIFYKFSVSLFGYRDRLEIKGLSTIYFGSFNL